MELTVLKMRLYDCEQSKGGDLLDSGQEEEYEPPSTNGMKNKFAKLNFNDTKQ